MKHARADYNRIQDPTADGPLRAALTALATVATCIPNEAGDCPCLFCGTECRDPGLDGGLCENADCATVKARTFLDDAERGMRGAPIGEDEPVFLVRAQDYASGPTVRAWAEFHDAMPIPPDPVGYVEDAASRMARAHADLMDAWPAKKRADV